MKNTQCSKNDTVHYQLQEIDPNTHWGLFLALGSKIIAQNIKVMYDSSQQFEMSFACGSIRKVAYNLIITNKFEKVYHSSPVSSFGSELEIHGTC